MPFGLGLFADFFMTIFCISKIQVYLWAAPSSRSSSRKVQKVHKMQRMTLQHPAQEAASASETESQNHTATKVAVYMCILSVCVCVHECVCVGKLNLM